MLATLGRWGFGAAAHAAVCVAYLEELFVEGTDSIAARRVGPHGLLGAWLDQRNRRGDAKQRGRAAQAERKAAGRIGDDARQRWAKQLAERTGKPWTGRVILVGDQDLKFSVLVDVMYTTGRAEFSEDSFCVIKKS